MLNSDHTIFRQCIPHLTVYYGEAVLGRCPPYENPRGCTLTDIAADFGVSGGAASGTLHRAERRIIKNFLDEPPV